MEIYEALLKEPKVRKAALERKLRGARPDISAYINDVPVAIEVQISTLGMDAIVRRTEEYARLGIYVLWLLQWTPYLDGARYTPRLFEKWIHAAYFGRVYYWIKDLTVAPYHFEPYLTTSPPDIWYSANEHEFLIPPFSRNLKRYRYPIPGKHLNLAKDFQGKDREAWKSGDFFIPPAKLFLN